MKKFYLFVLFSCIFSLLVGNNINMNIRNINPDSDDKPWLVGDFSDAETKPMMSQLEINRILNRIDVRNLRNSVDHSFSEFMRPVFNQDGGSCGSASRICYMFAYEINSYRNVSGSLPENIYPSHFTWLLTGQNSGKEEMACANGIPNSIDYGGDTYSDIYGGDIYWPTEGEDDYGWMNGYNLWFNAMHNRLDSNLHITLNTPENLLIIKSWMNDHHEDTDFHEGGVAGAGCAITGAVYAQIPAGEYEEGKYFVSAWGPTVDHGVTWSGYDDEVGFDFNNDGEITNDIDTNDDGIVDMSDWEQGALIMLNSWESGWANSGTVYVPYRLLKINNMGAEFYYIKKDYTPDNVLKVNMEYDKRRRIKLSIGISSDQNAIEPDAIIPCHHFNFAGLKDVAMLGVWADNIEHTEPMELGYDLTDHFFGIDTTEPYNYFLIVETTGNFGGVGTVNTVSVIDYSQGMQEIEYFSSLENVLITDGEPIYIPITMPGNPDSNPYIVVPQNQVSILYYDSAQPGSDNDPENAIDGNPETIWHTVWGDGDPCPHEIQLDLNGTHNLGAFSYLPRQVGSNGRIKDYELYLSQDGVDWGLPVSTGTWPNSSAQQIVFFTSTEAGYVRLVALSEVNNGPWTSIAEMNVYLTPEGTEIGQEEIPSSEIFIAKIISIYPNPFNPSTTVSFNLPNSNKVEILIYNIKGQIVKTLINKYYEKGSHAIIWDGIDNSSNPVSSGIYFYKLNVNGQNAAVKRCLLLK